MGRVQTWLRWAIGWALIASFYAHSVISADTAIVTPIVVSLILLLMLIEALGWLPTPPPRRPKTLARQIGLFLLVTTLGLWILTSVFNFARQPPSLRDLGQFSLYCVIPIFLFLSRGRRELLTFVARLCVIMTLVDLAFNLLVIAGLVAPVTRASFGFNGGDFQRYPGLSGGVLSGGEVALIGVLYSAWRTRCAAVKIPRWGWWLILGLCLLGLSLIDARRYVIGGAIGTVILLVPQARWVPLPLYAIAEAGVGLYATFVGYQHEQVLRARLMLAAVDDMMNVFWTGKGPYFTQSVEGSTFLQFWQGHVTESGALDIGIAFGAPAMVLFFASVAITLLARRASLSWIPVLVTVMAGQFAYNNPLSFLGSVMFFGSLICILVQEVPPARARGNAPWVRGGLAMMPG
jgi:hypothetical protein